MFRLAHGSPAPVSLPCQVKDQAWRVGRGVFFEPIYNLYSDYRPTVNTGRATRTGWPGLAVSVLYEVPA